MEEGWGKGVKELGMGARGLGMDMEVGTRGLGMGMKESLGWAQEGGGWAGSGQQRVGNGRERELGIGVNERWEWAGLEMAWKKPEDEIWNDEGFLGCKR